MVTETELDVRVEQLAPTLHAGTSYLRIILREIDQMYSVSCDATSASYDESISRAVREHAVHVIARSAEPSEAATALRQLLSEPWVGRAWVVYNAIRLGDTELEAAIEQQYNSRLTGNLV